MTLVEHPRVEQLNSHIGDMKRMTKGKSKNDKRKKQQCACMLLAFWLLSVGGCRVHTHLQGILSTLFLGVAL